MATARQILQQEIFDQCDQKLLAFVGVSNDSKKKKFGYLCLSDTKEPPSNIYIHQVLIFNTICHVYFLHLVYILYFQIKFDNKVVKKKRIWSLNELIAVDGKTSSQVTL